MNEFVEGSNSWWGEYSFEVEQIQSWVIGPITLYIQRRVNEWIFAYERSDVSADITLGWEHKADISKIPREYEQERYAFAEAPSRIRLLPTLAGKQVITRPTVPFHLMPDEEVTVYAATPVWIKVETVQPKTKLTSIATRKLSKTWFGVSTTKGELCYSTKTKCKIRIEEAPVSANRAVTPVRIKNLSPSQIELNEINLPMPYLGLYLAPDGNLWTSPISIAREKKAEEVTITFSKNPPDEMAQAELVTPPQKTWTGSVMKDAISSFFGESL